MLKDYLDRDIYNLITKTFNFSEITEIRMRANENLIVVVKNKKYYLKDDNGEFVKISKNIIENFVRRPLVELNEMERAELYDVLNEVLNSVGQQV